MKNIVSVVGVAFLLGFAYIPAFTNWVMSPLLPAGEAMVPGFITGLKVGIWSTLLVIGLVKNEWTDVYTKSEKLNWVVGGIAIVTLLSEFGNFGDAINAFWTAIPTNSRWNLLLVLISIVIVLAFAAYNRIAKRESADGKSTKKSAKTPAATS
jgi:hypothetical protein